MDMNKSFVLKNEERRPQWYVIDAENQILGRMATKVADMLRGKDKPYYTPHTDCGDYVIILNADKVKLTGDKLEQKEYHRYSGWMSGLKKTTAREMLVKHPTRLVEAAIKGMLPKNKLNRSIFKKLKAYASGEHPHIAHGPKTITL